MTSDISATANRVFTLTVEAAASDDLRSWLRLKKESFLFQHLILHQLDN